MSNIHLSEELAKSTETVSVSTRHGLVTGRRAANGAAVFLELPYALHPKRFEDPVPLPPGYRYAEKEYIHESAYGAQPNNDGQAVGTPFEDKVGLGAATENPLFVNLVIPPSFPTKTGFPVRIYIHGGFLQFGSPHGLKAQAQYIAEERSEVWVNIGYRLSAFGFLACDKPKVKGNFGFKDQWLALQWVKNNISAFGGGDLYVLRTAHYLMKSNGFLGDANNIQITGLSAGAHSVHQILHHASRLPAGEQAPFHSAVLQSNAIVSNPKKPQELRHQFQVLCRALDLDPEGPDVLSVLQDPDQVPFETIIKIIETEKLGLFGTFRGCMDDEWMSSSPNPMTWQRSGGFARGLLEHGVRSVIIGDLSEEWYLYSIAHPIEQKSDISTNLDRYYPHDLTEKMAKLYADLPEDAGAEAFTRQFGVILADGQVHLPLRLLHRDLLNAGYPVLRYEIRWTPEQVRPKGYVTHATDRVLWAFRLPVFQYSQVEVARRWLTEIAAEVQKLEKEGRSNRGVKKVLTLREDTTIEWMEDARWDEVIKIRKVLSGEEDL